MPDDSKLEHISDTAFWVATFRASESDRPNALFHDKFAGMLAGERGRHIAAEMPYGELIAWAMVVRTVTIDELIQRAISLGIDTVVNLGAGLDTRPYRMGVPATLHWIEVDFPQIISYKTDKLARHSPACKVKRIAADLSDLPVRREILHRIGTQSKKVLVVTEGVITYFTPGDAELLSHDLFAVSSFDYWIQDYYQGGAKVWAPSGLQRRLGDSSFNFEEKDWLSFFPRHGWEILENRLTLTEAHRIQRPFPFPSSVSAMPKEDQEKWKSASGCVLYRKPL